MSEAMMTQVRAAASVPLESARWGWRDLLTLCKPRVVLVMLVCALVGMALA